MCIWSGFFFNFNSACLTITPFWCHWDTIGCAVKTTLNGRTLLTWKSWKNLQNIWKISKLTLLRLYKICFSTLISLKCQISTDSHTKWWKKWMKFEIQLMPTISSTLNPIKTHPTSNMWKDSNWIGVCTKERSCQKMPLVNSICKFHLEPQKRFFNRFQLLPFIQSCRSRQNTFPERKVNTWPWNAIFCSRLLCCSQFIRSKLCVSDNSIVFYFI